MKWIIITVLAGALWSCVSDKQKYKKIYFDFDSLITAQIKDIKKHEAVLLKKTILNSLVDSLSIKPDSIQLRNELEMFRQIDDINKPMYKGLYQMETKEDINSNLTVRTFTTNIKTNVAFVKLFFNQKISRLKRIESSWAENNTMMNTQRFLMLEFDDYNGQPRLIHYRVTGYQKVIFSKSVSLAVEGWVKYPR
ncbi:MAG: hypothetical protein JSS93_05065 [Bacteroidetes bacterium]|nr:hypothetical protein [Bacteroidota bacterium]